MTYVTAHKDAYQLGSSLIESLIALSLVSTLYFTVTKLQINLLHQLKYTHQQEIAIQAQISLAEKLKSCLGNINCQQLEIERYTKTLAFGTSTLEHQPGSVNTLLSSVSWDKNRISKLKFSYA